MPCLYSTILLCSTYHERICSFAIDFPSAPIFDCSIDVLYKPDVLSQIMDITKQFINVSLQGGLFEDIAEGLRHAKVVVACVSDEVGYFSNIINVHVYLFQDSQAGFIRPQKFLFQSKRPLEMSYF